MNVANVVVGNRDEFVSSTQLGANVILRAAEQPEGVRLHAVRCAVKLVHHARRHCADPDEMRVEMVCAVAPQLTRKVYGLRKKRQHQRQHAGLEPGLFDDTFERPPIRQRFATQIIPVCC